MKIVECTQYSPSWWEARRGIPTASNFDKICTPATGKLSAQHVGLIHQLIAEKISFNPNMLTDGPMTAAMRNGSECEPEARRWYEYNTGQKVEQVGLCLTDDGRWGCSPDALVGEDGLLELKCPSPKTHVGYLLGAELPTEYKCQVYGQLLVTGRKWVDFVSYCPGFDAFIIRVEPGEFTVTLHNVLEQFWQKYEAALEHFESALHEKPVLATASGGPDWNVWTPSNGFID